MHDSDAPIKPKKKYEKKKQTKRSTEDFLCEPCNLMFNTNYKLNAHKYDVHNIPKPYPCEICDTRFLLKTNLKHHMEKNAPRSKQAHQMR